MSPRRRLLVRWALRFAAVNTGLALVVGVGYLWHYRPVGLVGGVYAAAAYLGHLTALSYLPLVAILIPLALLIPRPRLVLPVGVVLASAGVSLLLLDALLFVEHRYHLSVVTFMLLDPQTFAFLGVYFAVGVAIEGMLAARIWDRAPRAPVRRTGWCVALGLAICFAASHLVFAWAEAHYYVPVTAFTRYLPLYYPLNARNFQLDHGLLDRSVAHEAEVVRAIERAPDAVLDYPLAPLRCAPGAPGLNVLYVIVDGMRADSLTPALAPRLAGLEATSIRFDRHYSGGNASRPGVFSLFYGLPGSYWDAFADAMRPPVTMDMFRTTGYQFGAFTSAPVYGAVALDRTALARVPNLRLQTFAPYPGAGHSGKDRRMTEEWHEWLARRDPARPFWGLLYYNSAVVIDPPKDAPLVVPVAPGAPEQERERARYLTALRHIDALLGGVLDDLERRGLLDRTVIIVTSDHGLEFDDSGLGFTGHSTAYSEYQLHTPLLVHWPGRPPGRVSRRTSHNDIPPTLMTELFGCANPPSDYSSGQSLFSGAEWSWLIATSYSDFAVVEPDRVTVILPSGYEIRDRNYRLVQHPTLPREALRAAMREMSRFYR